MGSTYVSYEDNKPGQIGLRVCDEKGKRPKTVEITLSYEEVNEFIEQLNDMVAYGKRREKVNHE